MHVFVYEEECLWKEKVWTCQENSDSVVGHNVFTYGPVASARCQLVMDKLFIVEHGEVCVCVYVCVCVQVKKYVCVCVQVCDVLLLLTFLTRQSVLMHF